MSQLPEACAERLKAMLLNAFVRVEASLCLLLLAAARAKLCWQHSMASPMLMNLKRNVGRWSVCSNAPDCAFGPQREPIYINLISLVR